MKTFASFLCALAALALSACHDSGPQVSDYDLIWDTPSANASGAMPLGNGELGVNLWVEADGDLLFYLSRTDTWSETGRLLKLGKVRVSLSPNPFRTGQPFSQRLNLQEGRIDIEAGENDQRVRLTVFADAQEPVLYVTGYAEKPVNITAASEPWRTEPYDIPLQDSLLGLETEWPRTGTYDYTQVIESADHTVPVPDAVVWYHRNEHTVYDMTLKHHDLENAGDSIADPLMQRTFGVYMAGKEFGKASELTLETSKPVRHFDLKLATATVQTPDLSQWENQITRLWQDAPSGEKAIERTAAYWKSYWDRSWIFVDTPGSDQGFRITQSYLLQNWIAASAGRGNYPIKFNGSIFTVDPVYTNPDNKANPDFRLWGGPYWWQNTRLPYYPMLAGGHFEMMQPMFRFYQGHLPSFRTIAREYMGAGGAVIPETTSIFGLYRNRDYGWDRTGCQKGDLTNNAVRYIWSGSLELLSMMLDYYDYTGDSTFVRNQLLPMSTNILDYFRTRFPADDQGRMHIDFTQAIETYTGKTVRDDMPCVAGLHTVLGGLLALPESWISPQQRSQWQAMQASLPPIPTRQADGKTLYAPAGAYEPKPCNVENPELYNIFPFWLTHLGTGDRQMGIDTYNARLVKNAHGWSQDGQQAALLGLTDETRDNLLAKIDNTHPGHRFPAVWGPNFDWTPDQDHGSCLLLTLQLMVLQSHGDKVYLLPAFPADWNVDFKLHVRGGGVVEGDYRDGKWVKGPKQTGGKPLQLIEELP